MMAKYTFYLDIYPGMDPQRYSMSATTIPGKKWEQTKRIAFDVTIPDEILREVDGYASEVTRIRATEDPE